MIKVGSSVDVKGPLTVVQIDGSYAMVELMDPDSGYAMARLPHSWLVEHPSQEKRGISGVNPPHGTPGSKWAKGDLT
jgi:hypothetical protein